MGICHRKYRNPYKHYGYGGYYNHLYGVPSSFMTSRIPSNYYNECKFYSDKKEKCSFLNSNLNKLSNTVRSAN